MNIATLLDASANAPAFRSVPVRVGGQDAWIRIRRPGTGLALALERLTAMTARVEQLREAAAAQTSEADTAAHEAAVAARDAARAATIAALDERVYRYLAESVCGVAPPVFVPSPDPDKPPTPTSPDPCEAKAWQPYEVTADPRRHAPGRPFAGKLSPQVQQTVYLAVLAWLRDSGDEEVAASVATFRRPA